MCGTPDLVLPSCRGLWPYEQRRWRELLSSFSWCWPTDRRGLALAQELTGLSDLPELAPGIVPVLTVSADQNHATLWSFGAARGGQRQLPHDVRLGGAACEAWRAARAALPRSLPFLWRSVSDCWHQTQQGVRRLNAVHFARNTPAPERVLDGASIGLACALSLASSVLDVALPGDVVASAAIGPSGALRPVRGIGAKVRCARVCAPRIRRFLVHPENESEAIAAAEGCLDIISVTRVAEAVALVWGSRLEERLCELGSGGAQQCEEFVETLFHLALGGHGATIVWAPIAEAIRLALDRWQQLSHDARQRLQFAHNVALRHHGNRGSLEIPDAALLASMPAPWRESYCAHVVQQAADAGCPAVAAAEALALERLEGHRGVDATAGHLELLGALGRLYAVVGRPAEALELQQEAACGWLRIREFGQAAYPLSECYRLSGALCDRDAFQFAESVAARLGEAGPYVSLARGRALRELGCVVEAQVELTPLVNDRHVPAHLRWGALRGLLRCPSPSASASVAISQARAELDHELCADGAEANDARLAQLLITLNGAVDAGCSESADAALGEILDCEVQPVQHLIDAAHRLHQPTAAYVARLYPY